MVSVQCCSVFSSVWSALWCLFKNPICFSIFVLVYCSTQLGVLCKCHLASFAFATPILFQIVDGNVKKGPKNDLLVMCTYCQSITGLLSLLLGRFYECSMRLKSMQIWMPYGWCRQQDLKCSAKLKTLVFWRTVVMHFLTFINLQCSLCASSGVHNWCFSGYFCVKKLVHFYFDGHR